MALLLAGIMVLLPPIAGISLVDAKVGGLPITLIYVFVVWALLIAGAAALVRPLTDNRDAAVSGNSDQALPSNINKRRD